MTTTFYRNVWGALVLTLLIMTSLFTGFALAQGDWQGALMNGVITLFWIFSVIWFHVMALREQRGDIEKEHSKQKLNDSLQDLLKTIVDKHPHQHTHIEDEDHQKHHDVLMEVLKEVSGEDEPTDEQLPEIKKRFIAKTNHDIILTRDAIGINVKIAKKPLAPTKKAPVKKPVATKKTVTTKKEK
jgi:hypothetical protein